MGPHHKKTTLPAEFCDECYTLYRKNHIQAKKRKKIIYRFKMAAKLPIFISASFRFWQKFENHFPKGNEIWLKIGYYEYIYITEIKIGNLLLLWDFRGETIIFPRQPKC